MTAEGKRTVVRLQPGDRFLITDDEYGRALTGAPVGPDTDWQICTRLRSNYAATVVRLDSVTGQGARIRWDIVTDHGTVKAQVSGQTVTLAREHHTPAPFVTAAAPTAEPGPAYDVAAAGADGAAVVVASVRHIEPAAPTYDIRARGDRTGGFELIEISPDGSETWICSRFNRHQLETIRDARTAVTPAEPVTASPWGALTPATDGK